MHLDFGGAEINLPKPFNSKMTKKFKMWNVILLNDFVKIVIESSWHHNSM